jgi:regulator of protease activity HflC (stomatin/prohibitin superfamily)
VSHALFRRLPLLAVLLGLLAGCSSVNSRQVVDLGRFQRFYVERRLNENNHLDELIAAELRARGRVAGSGPRTMMPEDTQVIVTYDARWNWDFKTYLIELNLEFHTVIPTKKLADAQYYQPSLTPKAPPEAVRELVGRLFRK